MMKSCRFIGSAITVRLAVFHPMVPEFAETV